MPTTAFVKPAETAFARELVRWRVNGCNKEEMEGRRKEMRERVGQSYPILHGPQLIQWFRPI